MGNPASGLVLVELTYDRQIHQLSWECLSAGRKLADGLKGKTRPNKNRFDSSVRLFQRKTDVGRTDISQQAREKSHIGID